ncbi:hypothetical protein NC651_031103 [Populus alba x Populus x berolinensis]|nr:hypothetical protein NC651_031103 [Populus alba x Populus x berolinensis]
MGSRPTTATKETSWASKVRVSDSSTRFTLEPLSRQPIGHRLVISEEMLMDNADQWKHCMVENVTTTANGFMIFRFTTEEKMHAVLDKGPWMFGGKNIVLQQWHPRFQFDKTKISTLPVWVRLHGLPFPLWSKQGLSMAASMVGRPLSCDESTYNCLRLDYARVCVEVDAALPYVHEFEIESPLTSEPITVKVDYEWKPSRCEKCRIFGHSCAITPAPLLNKGKLPVSDIPLPIIKPPTEPSTSLQPPPVEGPIPIPILAPPQSIPNSTTKLPTVEAETVVAPLPPAPIQPLNANPKSAVITDSQPHYQPLSPPFIDTANCHVNRMVLLQSNSEGSTGSQSHHQPSLPPSIDTTNCFISRMDSLQSNSDAYSALEASNAETSTASIPHSESHDDSPKPSPKTVRKKKGGKKRKEARGLQWFIGSWNVWGLNNLQTQKAVHDWTTKNNLQLFGLLETKIAPANLHAVEANLGLPQWQFTSNMNSSSSCRILVGWNPHTIALNCVNVSSQWLTCEITAHCSVAPLKVTFVYGNNTPAARTALWTYLCQESSRNTSTPWMVLGDFNAIIRAEDRSGGDINWYHHQNEFSQCIRQSELIQLPYTGMKYTWHNGQQGEHTIQKKLDWTFGNSCLFTNFPAAHSVFMPRLISDHSAMLLHLATQPATRPRHFPFKFLNAWADRSEFMAIVQSSWGTHVAGNPMYRFTTKLCLLKYALRQLHHQYTNNITSRVSQAKYAWHEAQLYLDSHPTSGEAKNRERELATLYMQLCKDEESVLKQRSRINWLQLGDRNTKFFHNSLLHRQVRNRIHCLQDSTGTLVTDQQKMGMLASSYYEQLLSAPQVHSQGPIQHLYPIPISADSHSALSLPITDDDIKNALFSIPDSKSPGPDGYNAYFFKHCWSTIGPDFLEAVRYFFTANCLPRCVNATKLALVPKVENPSCMNDFRPISCCNVMYKCISKVIVNRLKAALVDVIGPSQTAFLPGRNISDAILLTQELMHNAHLNTGPARCALKVDLKKAFDTGRWDFILAGLEAINIPQQMVTWIKTCISTAYYTVSLNGEAHGFFKATRGIRQGLIFQATQNSSFKYHWRCSPNNITHISFVDDLMPHSKSSQKLSIFIRSRHGYSKGHMQTIKLPTGHITSEIFRVPLISTRLKHADCIPLLDRILSRVKLWTSTSLTYAGRLQLIKSVLFSIQVYWSSMFMLPCSIIKKLEGILSAFLWKGTSMSHTGAKVAWHSVCYPLSEGGLGIKNLKTWNKAAVLKHIWNLMVDKLLLASIGRLRTMDRLYGNATNTLCIMCGLQIETHEHLFFECKYTSAPYQTTTESIFQQIRNHLATMGMVGTIPARICAIWNLHAD